MDSRREWPCRHVGTGNVVVSIAEIVAPLFVPGDRPERFTKAAASGADAIIIDLEDAVSSDRKVQAREYLACNFTDLPILIRINGVDTRWWRDDLNAAMRLSPAGIMVPKADGGEPFFALCGAAAAAGVRVIALVETALGIARARDIAAHKSVTRLAFGSVDYCADLNCAHSREALLLARAELILASRIAGIAAPLDGVTTTLDDPEAVLQDARYARSLGFAGKLAIHPRQIPPLLAGFRPEAQEIEWAHAVLASGDAAVSVGGTMVDEPVRARARALLRLVG